ncbi:hypothetical protein [Paenibacillus yonginensis]|nr:hypothetical protein [Paenibacillus yonginensis]
MASPQHFFNILWISLDTNTIVAVTGKIAILRAIAEGGLKGKVMP